MLKVIKPGLSTTVQDLGRNGFYHLGVPPSGAADKYSFQIGNLLVGNPVHYAGIEAYLLGPTLLFMKRAVIAITGAPADILINGYAVPMWKSMEVKEGDILSFKFAKQGICTYLCIAGGIQLPEIMESKSTYVINQTVSVGGRKLHAGSELDFGATPSGTFEKIGKSLPDYFLPSFSKDLELHVVMGMSIHRISDEGLNVFLNNKWKISTESNRTAYRLRGGPIAFENFLPSFGAGSHSSNIVDAAYPIGGIMVTNPEEIIIPLNDAPTAGGFITIGALVSTELDSLNQCRPQTDIHFRAVTVEEAIDFRLCKRKLISTIVDWATE